MTHQDTQIHWSYWNDVELELKAKAKLKENEAK